MRGSSAKRHISLARIIEVLRMSAKESHSRTPRYPYVYGLLLVGLGTLCGLGFVTILHHSTQQQASVRANDGQAQRDGREALPKAVQKLLAVPSPSPQIAALAITGSCPGGQIAVPYQCQLSVSGGAPPYTWSIDSGMLPEGLSLDQNGLISGVPIQPFAPTNIQIMIAKK